MKKPRHVLVFHSPLLENAPADELDVLDETEYFRTGLLDLGFEVLVRPFPFDLITLEKQFQEVQPAFVVNLVETIFGSGRLVHLGPLMFEHFKVPYTGCQAGVIYTSSDKVLAKKLMNQAGIPTADFLTFEFLQESTNEISGHWIVKSTWEHASFGLDEREKLLFDNRIELLNRFKKETNPEHFFAERYIHGREFNLSVIGGSTMPAILPPAEIRFNYPEGKPRIVGYKAKWDEESFEYANTNRSFDFPEKDLPLLEKLKQISLDCWKIFGLSGYARVDFRVDEAGNIFVLEINANPCISPDSGFVAAATRAGLSQKEVIERIVGATFK